MMQEVVLRYSFLAVEYLRRTTGTHRRPHGVIRTFCRFIYRMYGDDWLGVEVGALPNGWDDSFRDGRGRVESVGERAYVTEVEE
jgi:hypothetical protein